VRGGLCDSLVVVELGSVSRGKYGRVWVYIRHWMRFGRPTPRWRRRIQSTGDPSLLDYVKSRAQSEFIRGLRFARVMKLLKNVMEVSSSGLEKRRRSCCCFVVHCQFPAYCHFKK